MIWQTEKDQWKNQRSDPRIAWKGTTAIPWIKFKNLLQNNASKISLLTIFYYCLKNFKLQQTECVYSMWSLLTTVIEVLLQEASKLLQIADDLILTYGFKRTWRKQENFVQTILPFVNEVSSR